MNRVALYLLLLLSLGTEAQRSVALDRQWRDPGPSARPWVFWYWMQAAVTREGIRADLIAMKEIGIGGAYLMPIKGAAKPPLIEPVVEQMSPAWWDMMRYAMQIADSLHLELAMHASDGFALAGGPWISPEMSMQKLVWAREVVDGGRPIDLQLSVPETNEGYYKDIEVLAMPTPASWERSSRNEQVTIGKDSANTRVGFTFARPFTCRTIIVHTKSSNYQAQRLWVEVSDDGIKFRRVTRLESPRHGWQDGDAAITHTIRATTSRFFRFVYDKEGSEPGSEDLDAAKWKPSFKFTEIELASRPSIYQYEGKAGAVWRLSKRTTKQQLPDSLCISRSKLIDITSRLDSSGRLRWTPPPGHWTILRIGHTSTGHRNETGGGGKGLECDKFDERVIGQQFDRWFGEAVRQAGPELAGRVLKVFHVDSWECGSQNWSVVFREEFKRRRGYDCLPWLPVMAGIGLGSAAASENFLHDIRQTIAELVEDKFYKTMAGLAHEKGCVFSAESVAPTMISDGMLHYQSADIPMGEFWLRSPTHDKPNDMLDAISGAHIYGKPVIQAEAFTELRLAWDEYPGMLKTLQDRNYAMGINRLVFHVFAHNPWMDRAPGMTLDGIGLYFQRDQTWWKPAKGWMEYTRRCQMMLQQGRPVADLAVFTGEELPRRSVLPDRLVSTLPGIFGDAVVERERSRLANVDVPLRTMPAGVVHGANMTGPEDWVDPLHGYAYDCINPDALLRLATVDSGDIVLPGGARYKILVIPGPHPMSPDPGVMSAAVAEKLLSLVRKGASVMADERVSELYRRIDKTKMFFGKASGRYFQVGKGRVIAAPYTGGGLSWYGLRQDFVCNESGIAYTHRTAPGLEIYFVSNQTDRSRSLECSFRNGDGSAEIWDPVTGEIIATGQERSKVLLELPANGSVFVVFRGHALEHPSNGVGSALEVKGPWRVNFGSKVSVFDSLTDWSLQADTTIRYFSGTADYQQTFDWTGDTARRLWLDLGTIHDIAAIKINGKECGVAWTPPYRVEITDAVIPGVNRIQIAVTNTWANRLIGDQRLAPKDHTTWTNAPYRLEGRLLPGGLIGPVRLLVSGLFFSLQE